MTGPVSNSCGYQSYSDWVSSSGMNPDPEVLAQETQAEADRAVEHFSATWDTPRCATPPMPDSKSCVTEPNNYHGQADSGGGCIIC